MLSDSPLRAALGVALLLAVGFAPLGGLTDDRTHHYEVEQVEVGDERLQTALVASPDVLACPSDGAARECRLERRVAERGSVVADGDVDDAAAYDVVAFPEDDSLRLYEPTRRSLSNGSVALDHEPISTADALAAVAPRAQGLGPRLPRLVERSSLTTDRPLVGWAAWAEGHGVVRSDGDYFVRAGHGNSGPGPNFGLVVRAALAVGALAAFWE